MDMLCRARRFTRLREGGKNLHRPRRMTFFALCSCLCVSVGGGGEMRATGGGRGLGSLPGLIIYSCPIVLAVMHASADNTWRLCWVIGHPLPFPPLSLLPPTPQFVLSHFVSPSRCPVQKCHSFQPRGQMACRYSCHTHTQRKFAFVFSSEGSLRP